MSQYIRRILAILIGLGLIILTIVLIVRGFSGGGSSNAPESQKDLSSYATTSASVSVTSDGPVVADQDYRSTVIKVSNTDVTIDVIQGYQGNVIQHQTFANNVNSYTVFLKSLQGLGFTKGDSDPAKGDGVGVCPTGHRYIYQLSGAGEDSFSFWSVSCSGGAGTFKGSAAQVRSLFERQVPTSAPASLLNSF